ARRRPELLAVLPVLSEAVVLLALLFVLQDLVRLGDLLEARLGRLLLRARVPVRVPLQGELPVGPLDVLRGRVARDAERLVVVLELHVVLAVATEPSRQYRDRRGSLTGGVHSDRCRET